VTTRSLWATEVDDYLDFPHAKQAFRIKRTVTDLDGKHERTEVVYGVTSLDARTANRSRVLQLVREHWTIENRIHYVRDVTFDEDRSQVRKGAAAQAMATLRNLAISILRIAGVQEVPRALRHCFRFPDVALRLIGL
jgi:predicted transposase YbfD/YdcC